MALNNFGLGFVFTAKDQASAVIHRLQGNFAKLDATTEKQVSKFKSNVAQFAIGLGAMTAGVVGVAGAFAMAKKAGEFEQALAGVQSVSNATSAELVKLHDAAIQAGIDTQFSPTEAVMGLRDLAQQGFSANESMKLLLPTLDLAAGSLGELTPSGAAGLVGQTLKAFGIEAKDATISVDRLLKTANMFALSPGELPAAVGIAARGASAIKADLSETLISLGLVKNIIPGLERASTAVAVGMEKMVNPSTQKDLKSIGVEAVNAAGKFRPFLDVLTDITGSAAFQKMTDAKQSAFLIGAFDQRAMGGINAILGQLRNGIKDTEGNMRSGADAVKYLRDQFKDAAGTAQNFRDKLLDTFEGQKTLLSGSSETLQILVGESFARVFKPLVSGVVTFVNLIIGAVKAIPEPLKDVFAKFFLGASATLAFFGAVIMAKAAIGLLVLSFGFLLPILQAALIAIAPVAIAFAGLGLIAAGVYVAFKNNVGGLGDSFTGAWDKIKLFASGVGQLFSEGGFSGEVMDSLNKAGNQGVKGFAIQVFLWFNRIKNFFTGLSDGFSAGIEALSPVFTFLKVAIFSVAEALGISMGSADENRTAFQAFGDTGKTIGRLFSVVASILSGTLGVALFGVTAAIGLFKAVWDSVGPVMMGVGRIIVGLVKIIAGIFTGDWRTIWTGAVDVAFGAIRLIIDAVLGLVSAVAHAADALGGVFGFDVGAAQGLNDLRGSLNQQMESAKVSLISGLSSERPTPAQGAIAGQAKASAAAAAPLMSAVGANQSSAPQQITVNVNSILDGKKVGQSVAKIKRGDAERSFVPMSSSEGMSGY